MTFSLGKKIKMLRNAAELSQESLACNFLSRTILSKIENDRVVPSIYQLQHISAILGVTIDSLLDTSPLNHNTYSQKNSCCNVSSLFNNKQYNIITSSYEKGLINISTDFNSLFYIGYSYFLTEFHKEGASLLKRYIKVFYTLDDSNTTTYLENVSKAYNTLSLIALEAENYNKAVSYCLDALSLLEKYCYTNTNIYQVILSNLASIYNRTNSYNKCIDIIENFLNSNPDMLHTKALASIHLSLNSAYYNLGNYTKSIDHIKKAIFFFDYIGDTYDSYECYLNYINALRYSHKYTEAKVILKSILDTGIDDLAPELYISFLMQKAIIHFNQENYDDVLDVLNRFNITQLDSYNRNCYYFMKGHVSFLKNDLELAQSYLKRCMNFFIKSNFSYDLQLLYENLFSITKDDKYIIKLKKVKLNFSCLRKNIISP